jgi:Zn-dependent protease
MELSLLQQIAVWALPILLAVTLHEAAHGWVAFKLGDPTAKLLGRVTLNPIRHIDPIGTIIVPLALGFLTKFSFIFGWAKPVPISPRNFKNPKRDNALVALAGPFANLIMCFMWASFMKIAIMNDPINNMAMLFLLFASKAGIMINLILCFLNLLPIPPLDGSRVVSSLLPGRYAYYYDKLEPFGFMILLALILTNVIGFILTPPFKWTLSLLNQIFGFNA